MKFLKFLILFSKIRECEKLSKKNREKMQSDITKKIENKKEYSSDFHNN